VVVVSNRNLPTQVAGPHLGSRVAASCLVPFGLGTIREARCDF
jgi:hypothetical protein